jgi:hypothetical protein
VHRDLMSRDENQRNELLRRFEAVISGAELEDLRRMVGDLPLLGVVAAQQPSQPHRRELRRPPMPLTVRSGKSQVPDLRAPINFAFRLRQLLGIGARAEAARFLLTVHAPSVTAQVVTESAGFAKRNEENGTSASATC